ncbi:MAG: YabP/YqfC family sporulation protein [Oscillospiraceae bacterium]|nr:YabP/YqfC family sporulation protein [Oscillospiraceae bacterium]
MTMIKKLFKDAAFYSSYISITDNEKVILENCRSINECSDIMVNISTTENDIEIWGTGLTVTSYTNTSIEINGKINTVSISKRRGAV